MNAVPLNAPPMQAAHWLRSRQIRRRIEVKGTLTLLSPAAFGGEQDGVTDMPLLRDPLQGVALLPGASLAGALRAYLWDVEQGYGVDFNRDRQSHRDALAVQLFGGEQGDAKGLQSPLVVDEALGQPPQTELRDLVEIDPATRTAADRKKFDVELLRAGTTFDLHFELLIGADDDEAALRRALALALGGLETPGEITLGRRKRRGLGECQVAAWLLREWDLTTAQGLVDYLAGAGAWRSGPIAALLGVQDPSGQTLLASVDRRAWFELDAGFLLEGSLLVRSGVGVQGLDSGPDALHLHRPRADGETREAILPGTSLGGALRARARRIAQTLHGPAGLALVDTLFGGQLPPVGKNRDKDRRPRYRGGRVEVRERVVEHAAGRTFVQPRLHGDRFTGGVLDAMLFEEAPLFAGGQTRLTVHLRLRDPKPGEIGLILQTLKDLWLADLALGGGANVGRGRLLGRRAELVYCTPADTNRPLQRWTLAAGDAPGAIRCTQGTPDGLEEFAKQLVDWKLQP